MSEYQKDRIDVHFVVDLTEQGFQCHNVVEDGCLSGSGPGCPHGHSGTGDTVAKAIANYCATFHVYGFTPEEDD